MVGQQSAPAAKIALFRSLFRGREDVYPRRFESRRTGKSGYAPACANEWVRGICEKPRIKCAECAHRRFLPVTDDVILWHLSGVDADGHGAHVRAREGAARGGGVPASDRAGVWGGAPLSQDETTFFLAVDFDKQGWRDDAAAFRETCRQMGLTAALERSRSGRGGHVWLFFDEAVPAALARKLGSHILTETMEHRPDLGLDSYDRFFPSQDTLPHGGFGNLIALPLQKRPRERGNSVFIDDELAPYADQWAFLSTVPRIERARAEDLVREAERRGRVVGVRLPRDEDGEDEPWTLSPSRRRKVPPITGALPRTMELVLGNEIYIASDDLVPPLRNRLARLAAFQNPDFYKAQAMRLPTYDKPRIIGCVEAHPNHLGLPRGCLDEVQQLLSDLHIAPVVRDERSAGAPVDVAFRGTLRPEQQVAADALLAHDTGVLSATTAFGKTVIAAWLIAQRGVNTLALVHRRQLLEQWVDRLSAFLDLPAAKIGRIGGGRRKPTGVLDVALIQSLVRQGVVRDQVGAGGKARTRAPRGCGVGPWGSPRSARVGFGAKPRLGNDECHHLPAHRFEQVARRAKVRFVVGLSATVTRKDGHHPIVFMQCRPVRYRVSAKAQAARQPFSHTVIVRPTAFQLLTSTGSDARVEFQSLCAALINDDARNKGISDEVVEVVRDGRSPLVLTERREHLERLAGHLAERVRHLVVLRGGTGRRQQQAVADQLAAIPDTEERVLLATGRYLGEGFDDARLDTLFLTLPVSWRGTIAQYVGRLHRLYDGKRDVRVYDYADLNVPMLARMFDRRCRGYDAVGYTVDLPASAVPGWPPGVALPADPRWKSDYAGSVRRLIRDGLTPPLAGLFADAARSIPSDAEGASRARSASEAFLYRRLETLPETKGRFQLNVALPIPFDGVGQMEVDLLCDDARLVVELDGAHHLADAVAYRRDRRKDQLLQENGYLVLRYLVEDLAKDLATVLDAILGSLAGRQRARVELLGR